MYIALALDDISTTTISIETVKSEAAGLVNFVLLHKNLSLCRVMTISFLFLILRVFTSLYKIV